ncbi:MAG: type IX secretion system membrane protein PorP/SprF [Paludibacteraceae bacterium]|nr:type IX secretion system membrane protein PorP/SprF [Paludibacteraceae bacterium]
MRKKHLISIVFFLTISILNTVAQMQSQFSQYMELPTTTNPAAVAEDEMMSVFGVFRRQWVGFGGGPQNVFCSFNAPFKTGETKHGAGLVFSSDEIGLFKNQSVLLQYSYKTKLWGGRLSLGLGVGFIDHTFDKDNVEYTGGDEGKMMSGDDFHKENDPFISSFTAEGYSDVLFDVSFGCLYTGDKYYIGLSALHLNSGTIDLGSESYMLYIPRQFYLTGGYNFSTSNPLVTLTPSAMLKTDFISWQAEVSGLLEYNKRVRGGISYRFGDAFVFILGMDVISGLRLGYSYDLPTSKLIRSGGSHEVYLRYSFRPQFTKKNKYKSDRIL